LNSIIKSWLKGALSGAFCRFAGGSHKTGPRVPVLCYHRVLPEVGGDGGHDFLSISSEQFASQMKFLSREGFYTLTLEEYARMARGLQPLIRRSILITFDDGFADNFQIAWPLAQEYNAKLNLFICTGLVSQSNPVIMMEDGYLIADSGPSAASFQNAKLRELSRPLTWQELGEMRDSGVQMGFHSHSHRNLARLSADALAAEVETGLDLFVKKLGYRPRLMALPYGRREHHHPKMIAFLRSRGLEVIFSVRFGRAKLPTRQPVLPRITIFPQDDLTTFKRKIFGAYDWLG